MDEQTRLLALARFKHDASATDVSNELGITYARALKLRKELKEAEENDAIRELFNLPEDALAILLEAVKDNVAPAIEAFALEGELEEAVEDITKGVQGAKLLDTALQDAAKALANKIQVAAATANNTETLLNLAKALAELNNSFFGSSSSATQGVPGLPSPESGLQRLMRD